MFLLMRRTPFHFFDFFRAYDEKGIKPVLNTLCDNDNNLPKYCEVEMKRYQETYSEACLSNNNQVTKFVEKFIIENCHQGEFAVEHFYLDLRTI